MNHAPPMDQLPFPTPPQILMMGAGEISDYHIEGVAAAGGEIRTIVSRSRRAALTRSVASFRVVWNCPAYTFGHVPHRGVLSVHAA